MGTFRIPGIGLGYCLLLHLEIGQSYGQGGLFYSHSPLCLTNWVPGKRLHSSRSNQWDQVFHRATVGQNVGIKSKFSVPYRMNAVPFIENSKLTFFLKIQICGQEIFLKICLELYITEK